MIVIALMKKVSLKVNLVGVHLIAIVIAGFGMQFILNLIETYDGEFRPPSSKQY